MTCTETRGLLSAYFDGELDSVVSVSIKRHVQRCECCLIEIENMRVLSSAIANGPLRFELPEHLKTNLQIAGRVADPAPRKWLLNWRFGAAMASVVSLTAMVWAMNMHQTKSLEERLLVTELVTSHVRSMMADHMTDVSSSDSHTVKPWFVGKLDFSPPAKDLTEQGFSLIGGRLDYLENRPVAALVDRRRQHFINLFIWPSISSSLLGQEQLTSRGYNLIHWIDSGMTYWLVSELNAAELTECAHLLKQ